MFYLNKLPIQFQPNSIAPLMPLYFLSGSYQLFLRLLFGYKADNNRTTSVQQTDNNWR